jgi:hypothetical protein
MSRASLRKQLTTFLSDAQMEGVNQVFSSFPNRINFQHNAVPGQKSRAAIVVFIESESETRVALGGSYSGKKRIDYGVVVQLFHHSMWNESEQAMSDFDDTVDAIKDRLRSDHRFGDPTGNIIWQGAEPEIAVDYGEPSRTDGGATETWAAIRFQVTQFLTA